MSEVTTETEAKSAQAHYDKVSTTAHEWHSAIPKAIDAYYYADPERERLRDQVIELAKKMRRERKVVSYEFDQAVDALIDFESQNKE